MNVTLARIDAIAVQRVKSLELVNLLDGGNGTRSHAVLLVYSPDLNEPVRLPVQCLGIVQRLLENGEAEYEELRAEYGDPAVTDALNASILLPSLKTLTPNVQQTSEVSIDELSRAFIQHSKWGGTALHAHNEPSDSISLQHLVREYGPPPTHNYRRYWSSEVPLPRTRFLSVDSVFPERKTTRQFSTEASIHIESLAAVLSRAFGATHQYELVPGLSVHRKNAPSGGGLHAVEAYVLCSRIEGLPPGIYHYISAVNSLERLPNIQNDVPIASLLASSLAHQAWAADVNAALLLTVRLDRLFWRYRFHPKALRVAYMDAGHLSQIAYMVAAELGLGVILTAAINERDIERILALNPSHETPLAAIGLGVKATG